MWSRRSALFLGGLVVLTAALAFCSVPASHADDDKTPDSVTPVAASIEKLDNVTLTIGDQAYRTTLTYSRRGTTLFALPVWVIAGKEVEISTTRDSPAWRVLPAGTPFLKEGEPYPALVQVKIADLLAGEETRQAVYARLKQEFAGEAGGKTGPLAIRRPNINPDAYTVTLYVAGTGRAGSPKEVPVSRPCELPKVIAEEGGGELTLELLPENLVLVAAARGRPVLPRDCFLRISGSMKARFERLQYEANFEVLRAAVTDLQHHLGSLNPSTREAPEVFLQVPAGGTVTATTAVSTVMSQYLVGTISVREGASDRDHAAVQKLAEGLLPKLFTQVKARDLEDDKRVALLLGSNATLSATVGEIKQLAKATRQERDRQLAAALEEAEARRSGEAREYRGKIGLDVSPFASLGPRVGGSLSAAMKKQIEEERANQRKQQLAVLHRDLDQVAKAFDGRIPTLTGIRFDQEEMNKSLDSFKTQIQKLDFTYGPSEVNWPAVRLGGAAPQLLTPRFLADELARTRRQYEELRQQHEAFRKTLASAEHIAELEKSARELAERLKDSLARVDELEKQVTDLTAPQHAASEMLAKVKRVGGIDLVGIPAGEFDMGSEKDDKDAYIDEKPRHKVTIAKPFYLGKTEVTVGQFKRFVKATGYQTEAEKAGDKKTWKNTGFEQTDDHPVVCVTWNDAVAYCGWLAKETGAKVRLPRETEWEYSCRAGAATKFCFGDDEGKLGQYAWYTKNTGDKGTRACGLKLPNAWGLYDMHGNAWEWCLDGRRTYQDRAEIDPEGPGAGAPRVLRGGSFGNGPRSCRAALRYAPAPSGRSELIGFRVLVVR